MPYIWLLVSGEKQVSEFAPCIFGAAMQESDDLNVNQIGFINSRRRWLNHRTVSAAS